MTRFARISLLIVLALVLSAGSASAQSLIKIKLGTYNPKDAKAGFIIGISSGKQFDERVDAGLGVDLFMRQYTQETAVDTLDSQGGNTYVTVQKNIDYSVFCLPITGQLTIRLLPKSPISPYAGVGLGYEILFSREANYFTGQKDSRLYGGFGWQVNVGGEYILGSSSSILGEIFYNGCTVSRNKGKSDAGFPIHEELNFSGIGFRVGVRLGG
ncbi:MAG: outer membrane beta-barrel protein [bacterium]|nr:outer membrane beta-barrel protein [bacterium]